MLQYDKYKKTYLTNRNGKIYNYKSLENETYNPKQHNTPYKANNKTLAWRCIRTLAPHTDERPLDHRAIL